MSSMPNEACLNLRCLEKSSTYTAAGTIHNNGDNTTVTSISVDPATLMEKKEATLTMSF